MKQLSRCRNKGWRQKKNKTGIKRHTSWAAWMRFSVFDSVVVWEVAMVSCLLPLPPPKIPEPWRQDRCVSSAKTHNKRRLRWEEACSMGCALHLTEQRTKQKSAKHKNAPLTKPPRPPLLCCCSLGSASPGRAICGARSYTISRS